MTRTWAVVLAGGEGSRLSSVTTALTGSPTPKQFCRLLGRLTLLEETAQRLKGLADDRRTMVLVTASHRAFYQDLARNFWPGAFAEQPANLGTAVGMAFALGRVRRTDRDAVVAFFPSDHHYANVGAFREAVSAAFRAASQQRDRLVLVGATPQAPEPDYGWIERGLCHNWPDTAYPVFSVKRFWEKPDALVAHRLFSQHCLWNTFITVGTIDAFRSAFEATQPFLASAVDAISAAVPADEANVVDAIYEQSPRVCFSSKVLAAAPDRCVVVPLRASGWMDIGHPQRLADAKSA